MKDFIQNFFSYFEYVSKEDAKNRGCTEYGSFYGMPVWINWDSGGGIPCIDAIWYPLNFVIDIGHWFVDNISNHPGEYPLVVKGEIE